jgi:hypothetical protein
MTAVARDAKLDLSAAELAAWLESGLQSVPGLHPYYTSGSAAEASGAQVCRGIRSSDL